MKKWLLPLILSVALVTASCAQKEEEAAPPVEPQPEVQEEQEEPEQEPEEEEKPPFTAPLTGKGSETEINNRILMVMFGNNPEARPQSGLNKADMVYEILAEGTITRLVGFFQSQVPEVIGPVRSIRSYFVDLAQGLNAIMVNVGRSNQAHALITTKAYDDIDEIYTSGASFWRESFRKAPNNVYTNIDKLNEAIEAKKFRAESETLPLLFKDPEEAPVGQDANVVKVNYSSRYGVTYTYDAEKKVYKRSLGDSPHVDLTTGDQLTATNIIIAKTPHKVLDNAGHLQVDLNGPGEGWIIQQGKLQEIEWTRKNGMIRAYVDAKEVALYPGQTWVHVIPTVGSSVEYN